MSLREPQPIPRGVQDESVILSLYSAHQKIGKALERRIRVSPTRGRILASFRGGPRLNQNQIATLLDLDRTVTHRTIKALIKEGLMKETPARTGRSLLLSLTALGEKERQALVEERKALETEVRARLGKGRSETLRSLLRTLAAQTFDGEGRVEETALLPKPAASPAVGVARRPKPTRRTAGPWKNT